jgi:hypothetical protein
MSHLAHLTQHMNHPTLLKVYAVLACLLSYYAFIVTILSLSFFLVHYHVQRALQRGSLSPPEYEQLLALLSECSSFWGYLRYFVWSLPLAVIIIRRIVDLCRKSRKNGQEQTEKEPLLLSRPLFSSQVFTIKDS